MTKADYESKVNPEFCGIQSYVDWVKFSDSFPPLPIERYPKISFYEILVGGSIMIVGIYLKPDGEGRIATMISHRDLFKGILEDKEYCENSYWRYLPPPPDGSWYDDSEVPSDYFNKKS